MEITRDAYISNFYNTISDAYAKKFSNELNHKYFDQILLRAFAKECDGKVLDIACGPGQTTRFLKDCGVNIQGVDLSINMIKSAKEAHPDIRFESGNMLKFEYKNGEFNHAICFYGIVHFTMDELLSALLEINRILKSNGNFLFSFHIGSDVIHFDEFYGHKVDINFQLFKKKEVLDLCLKSDFEIVNVIQRNPYPDIESDTQRAYIWVRKGTK